MDEIDSSENEVNWQNLFRPEDFEIYKLIADISEQQKLADAGSKLMAIAYADRANRRFRDIIEKCQELEICRQKGDKKWRAKYMYDTIESEKHDFAKARLICIEKIGK